MADGETSYESGEEVIENFKRQGRLEVIQWIKNNGHFSIYTSAHSNDELKRKAPTGIFIFVEDWKMLLLANGVDERALNKEQGKLF